MYGTDAVRISITPPPELNNTFGSNRIPSPLTILGTLEACPASRSFATLLSPRMKKTLSDKYASITLFVPMTRYGVLSDHFVLNHMFDRVFLPSYFDSLLQSAKNKNNEKVYFQTIHNKTTINNMSTILTMKRVGKSVIYFIDKPYTRST